MEKDIKILLADDDKDDRFFFTLALKGLNFKTNLTTVNDGAELLDHLRKNPEEHPDIVFLDLNMPKKNGFEALSELRSDKVTTAIPVVIYSTSYDEHIADVLYHKGANFYIRKTDVDELRGVLHQFFSKHAVNSFARPNKDEFVFAV